MTDRSPSSSQDRLRVLVTGATSGVGEAAAKLFADRGARVALVGRREAELRRVRAEIGDAAPIIAADVSDPAAASGAVVSAIEAMGGLDIVVNAAGVAEPAPIEEVDAGLWRRVIDTNLTAAFHVSRAAALHMRSAGGGSIVNVASDLAVMGAAGLVPYCASKAGLLGLTRALAVELAPTVRVNAVCPGPIDTPMLRSGLETAADPELALREKEATVPLNRLADPVEVAAAIYFLAVEGTFATGTGMAFDGGTSAA